jgi:hypothetical protein
LDASNETFVDEKTESVIDRLSGDCSDVGLCGFRNVVGGAVGLVSDGTQDGESLRRDVESMTLEHIGVVGGHVLESRQILDKVQNLDDVKSVSPP